MTTNEGEAILLKRNAKRLLHVPHCPDRRRFLTLGTGALLTAYGLTSVPALADSTRGPRERTITIHNLHTGENLKAVYWADGAYVDEELARVNYLMRDYRNDQVKDIHPQLLDLLHTISERLDTTKPFQLISGYRSPVTNAMLHARSDGVAKYSLHMDGMASDIRIPGVDLKTLRKAALSLRVGGVGYYPKSNFVHVDIGRVRQWSGV